MCNLYTYEMTAEDMRLLKEHYRLVGTEYLDILRGRNTPADVYPNYEAPVMRRQGDATLIEPMRWGFPPPPFAKTKAPVTNVRNVSKGYWKPYLGIEHRFLVPATAFSEWDAQFKKPRWFARIDGKPFCFAGIWRPWTGDRGTKAKPNVGDHRLYSFLTTEPNSVVAPIHPKAMPVLLLDDASIEQWLTGTDDEALQVQKPAPDDVLKIVERKKKED